MNINLNLLKTNIFKCVQYNGLKSWTGGIDYNGIKFFPRFPDHKEPPCEPTKLFMVQRTQKFKGNAYFLKRILVEFGLDGKAGEIAIVKNTPENVVSLYKIKHLIRITPIKTPNGIPDENDLGAGFLKENGEFVVSKRLRPDPVRLQLTSDFQTDPGRLDADTLKKQSRDRWNNPWN